MGMAFGGQELVHMMYSTFDDIRTCLWAVAGHCDLSEMEGYGGPRPWSEIDDDIVPLMDCRDDEDVIEHQYLSALIERMKELIPKVECCSDFHDTMWMLVRHMERSRDKVSGCGWN